MPKFSNVLRTYSRLRKGEEHLFCILHKIVETICFSNDVCQFNLCMYKFVFKVAQHSFHSPRAHAATQPPGHCDVRKA